MTEGGLARILLENLTSMALGRIRHSHRISAGILAITILGSACGEVTLEATERAEGPGSKGSTYPTFQVIDRFLVDPCGKRVVLRGVNELIVWSSGIDGIPEFAEIARAGANAVRIVWTSDTPPAALDAVISNARVQSLIPMVELHDGQGDFSKLPKLIDYWASPEAVAIVNKHQRYLLVSIGSGVGATVDATTWENGYLDAIVRLRRAGIRTPIVVDAPGYGNDIDRIQASGATVRAADPLGNTLFGVALWGTTQDATWLHQELLETVNLGLPLVIGEFSGYGIADCPTLPFDYRSLMAEAQAMQVGWFAWSWGSVKNANCSGALDMTTDGTLEGLTGWGLDVATTDRNSMAKTSVRPSSMVTEGCQ